MADSISDASCVQSAIHSSSEVLLIDSKAKKIIYKSSIKDDDSHTHAIETQEIFADVSILSVGASILSFALSADLPIPFLLRCIKQYDKSKEREQSPTASIFTPKEKKLKNFSFVNTSRLMDTDKPIVRDNHNQLEVSILEESPKEYEKRSTISYLRQKGSHLDLKNFSGLETIFKYLSSDSLTHVNASADGKVMIFATTSSLSSFIDCKPVASIPLSSQVIHMELTYCKQQPAECVLLRLENDSIQIYDLNQLSLIYENNFGKIESMCISSFGHLALETLIIVSKDGEKIETKNRSFKHSLLGTYYLVPLNELPSQISINTNQDADPLPLVEAVKTGIDSRSSSSLPNAVSGIESLFNALEGRLKVSISSLEETKMRLEGKRDILRRSLFLLSRLSMTTSRDLIPVYQPNTSFVVDNDMVPIIGSTTELENGEKMDVSKEEQISGQEVEILTSKIVPSNNSFLLQIFMRNKSHVDCVQARNLISISSSASVQSQQANSPEMKPLQSGVSTFSISVLPDSSMDPYEEISFFLEIVWRSETPQPNGLTPTESSLRRSNPHRGVFKTQVISLGIAKLDFFSTVASTDSNLLPILSIPSCPHFASILASSGCVATEIPTKNFFSTRFHQSDPNETSYENLHTGMIIKTYSQGSSTCIEIGSIKSEEDILRLIQALYRYFDTLELGEVPKEVSLDGRESEATSLRLTENVLTKNWMSRCRRLLDSLKYEIQVSISLAQLLSESSDENSTFAKWKLQYEQVQSQTDLLASQLSTLLERA